MSNENTAVLEKAPQTSQPARVDITAVVVTSWEDMQRMALAFSKSALIPPHLKGKFEDVLVILQTSKELNIPPMQGINGINVIQGKPSISPELQLALIKSNCPNAFIKIEEDHKTQTVRCTMAPSRERMDESFVSTWDMARAKSMHLADKDNYKKQPMTMLKWRAVGEAARTVFPHVTKGLYNFEEARDLGAVDTKPSLGQIFGVQKPAIEAESKTIEIGEHSDELEIER